MLQQFRCAFQVVGQVRRTLAHVAQEHAPDLFRQCVFTSWLGFSAFEPAGLLDVRHRFGSIGVGYSGACRRNSHWFDVRTSIRAYAAASALAAASGLGKQGHGLEGRIRQSNGENNSLTAVFGGTAAGDVSFYAQNALAASTAACSVWVNAASNTSRSINCGGTVAAYTAAKAELAAALELERQKVDRIAYSGRVPVNVTGA